MNTKKLEIALWVLVLISNLFLIFSAILKETIAIKFGLFVTTILVIIAYLTNYINRRLSKK